jgi:hypothetical protein
VLRAGDPQFPHPPAAAAPVFLLELDATSGALLQTLALVSTASAAAPALTLATSSADESAAIEGAIGADAGACAVAVLGYNVSAGGSLAPRDKVLTAVLVGADGAPRVAGAWAFTGLGYSRADGAVAAPGGAGVFAVAGQSAGCAVAYVDAATGAATEVFPGGVFICLFLSLSLDASTADF